MDSDQNYSNHRRTYPPFHFFVVPILTINVIVALKVLWDVRSISAVWSVIVAISVLLMAFIARVFAVTVQDRLIVLEERVRLAAMLPEDLKARMGELKKGQLIALRFASDGELVELTRSILDGKLKGRDQIKRSITNWRPDLSRV